MLKPLQKISLSHREAGIAGLGKAIKNSAWKVMLYDLEQLPKLFW